MRSLLIVDDEYYIRARVQRCVDWQALGFDRIVECSNGQEALALMKKQSFDLVVADISMPIMDGLTLCEKIINLHYDTLIILLTGYDKFEYAQQAVSYNVVEYILKPVDSNEMEKAVRKALSRMDERAYLEAQKKERETLHTQTILLKRELFLRIVLSDGYLNRPAAAEQMKLYGIYADMTYYVVYSRSQKLASATQIDGGIALPFGMAWIVLKHTLAEWIHDFRVQNPTPVLGISSAHCGTPKEIFQACREARLIASQHILKSEETVFYYNEYAAGHENANQDVLITYRDTFDAALRTQNQGQAEAALFQGLSQLTSVLDGYLFIENILTSIQKSTIREESGWEDSALFKMQAFDMLCNSESLNELQELLLKMVREFFLKSQQFSFNAGMLLVKKVRQMVSRHYMEEDLSVGSIAEALSLNASYLSDSFGCYNGQSLSQYIMQVRMEKARELLADEALSLVDVMEQVGYKDPYYFSRRFKKYFGYSPSAYRRTR